MTADLNSSLWFAGAGSVDVVRILLTGAAGFIGSAIADRLRAAGHDVVGYDLLLPQAHSGRPSWVGEDLVVGDVRDAGALATALRGVDAVCHQAAMVGLGESAYDAPAFVAHNVTGTVTLLTAMLTAGCRRLVQASSMVVYGDGLYRCPDHGDVRPGPRLEADLVIGRFEPGCPRCGASVASRPLTEEAACDPQTTYAATKHAQETLAAAWARQSGARVISLRYHNVYGPRMPRDTPYAGVASMFRSALAAGRAPLVFEDGRQLRDFVHVTDVAHADELALGAIDDVVAPGGHRTYNVASGRPATVLEMARLLSQATGGPAPQVVGGGRPGDVRHIVADPSRARRELGLTAQIGLDEGLADFAIAPLRAS